MKKIYFRPKTDGFYGMYYPNQKATNKAMTEIYRILKPGGILFAPCPPKK